MPRSTQKTVTLAKQIYKVAEAGAKREKMSVAGYVGSLILIDNPKLYDILGKGTQKGGD